MSEITSSDSTSLAVVGRLREHVGKIKTVLAESGIANKTEQQNILRRLQKLQQFCQHYGLEELSTSISNIVGAVDGASPGPDQQELIERIELLLSSAVERVGAMAVPEVGKIKQSKDVLIYLIEDTVWQAQYLSAQLRTFGFEVEVFHNATDAVIAATERTPSVVIADVVLPEGERAGLEAIQIIRKNCSPPPPVIAVSSRVDFETRLPAIRAGVATYLMKPVNIVQLIDKINSLCLGNDDEPLRAIVIDDQQTITMVYSAMLMKKGFVTETCNEPRMALEKIAAFMPDIILCDLHMPTCSGFELAEMIRQDPANEGIPIVFLSGDDNTMPRWVDSLKHGGDEFLSKTLHRDWVVPIATMRAQRSRKTRSLMLRDSMTGLYKHTTIKDFLGRELARTSRGATTCTVAMVDIDFFKKVNDTHGHAAGDRVIISLARFLSQNLRRTDIVGRYGGEEFCVVMPDTRIEVAATVLDNLRERFSKIEHQFAEATLQVTCSVGVACSPPQNSVSELLEAADEALYLAKSSGRNRVVWDNT